MQQTLDEIDTQALATECVNFFEENADKSDMAYRASGESLIEIVKYFVEQH
jgi:hypothetical protein